MKQDKKPTKERKVRSEKVPSKPLTSKSILNLLHDRNRIKERAEYIGRKKWADEEKRGNDFLWDMGTAVLLKDGLGWARLCGNGVDRKKSAAITKAADDVVAQLKMHGAALRDEMICGVLGVPFGKKDGGNADGAPDEDWLANNIVMRFGKIELHETKGGEEKEEGGKEASDVVAPTDKDI